MPEAVSALSVDQLLEAYREAANSHGKATQVGNYRAANRAAKRLEACHAELVCRGRSAQEGLLRMLDDQSAHVRLWAATHCLAFRADLAVTVLEALLASGGHVGLGAEMTLGEWRAGRLRSL
jgi:hypothetical protein